MINNIDKNARFCMKSSLIGKLIVKVLLSSKRISPFIVRTVVRLEGGQMTSVTLREILRENYGVDVGNYSYGSLLVPGMSDRGLKIGAYVSVGPNVRRFGAAHPIEELSMHPYFYNPVLGLVDQDSDVRRTTCVIGDDVWIGANVSILPGCTAIGTGAVIGAGSVVTKNVPVFSIVVGNPARVVRERLTRGEREVVLRPGFWQRNPVTIDSEIRPR